MKGIITKIHPPKESNNGKNTFIRVEFELENGKWAKTDLCPDYRNYAKWSGQLKVGTTLHNLSLKDDHTINADSNIVVL